MHPKKQYLTDLRRLRLFSSCTDAELTRILGLSTPVRVPAGAVLAAEGTLVREFLVIASGTADATIGGDHVRTLHPDDVVGETALGAHCRHHATVTAGTDLVAHVSSQREYQEMVKTIPRLAQTLLLQPAQLPPALDNLTSALTRSYAVAER